MKRIFLAVATACLFALTTGCVATSSEMVKTSSSPQPAADKALVVFMRPSLLGAAIQSSVYDAHTGSAEFIGIVSPRTKVAYQAEPGNHLFMVVGENADFLNADLQAGKTYYVLVSPRMGMWKARFSLLPIHNDAAAKYSLRSPDFSNWQQGTSFVEKSPSADAWYQAHSADISAKQAAYMIKWNAASAQQKAELTLHPEDGI